MVGLIYMRGLSVLVAVALAGCHLQGIPTNPGVESTFLAHAPVADLPAQFKVVTFNVHMEPGAKIAKAMLGDRDLRDADLILMEEVPRTDATCSGACAMGRMLGMYAVFAPGHVDGTKDIGVAILSKAPITSARVIELPWNDVHFNAGRRIALVATLQQAGHPITVYAVHLENRITASDRAKQMRPVLEDAQRQRTPVIIAGDFNTNPFTWISHWLPLPTFGYQARHLEALVRSYGFDTPVVESGATHHFIGMKLDAIYTRGFETKRFAVANAQDVSDHLALWAYMAPMQPPASAPTAGTASAPTPGTASAPTPGTASAPTPGTASAPTPGTAPARVGDATAGRRPSAESRRN